MCDIDIDSIKNEIYMNSNSFIVEQRAIKLEERRDGLSSNKDNTPTIYRYTGVLDMFINLEDCMKMAGLTYNEIDKLEKNALFHLDEHLAMSMISGLYVTFLIGCMIHLTSLITQPNYIASVCLLHN